MTTEKNSTVFEYALGKKNIQQTKYIKETRKIGKTDELREFKGNSLASNFNYNPNYDHYQSNENNNVESDPALELKRISSYGYEAAETHPQDASSLIKKNSDIQRYKKFFSPKFLNSNSYEARKHDSLKAANKENQVCKLYGFAIFTLAVITIVTLVMFCIIYFGVFTVMPTYLQPCSKTNPCAYFKNLFCNSTCICGSDQYWNGSKCTTLLKFGSKCTDSTECDIGLTCLNQICQCLSTTVSFFNE